jgi:hypothetical protein
MATAKKVTVYEAKSGKPIEVEPVDAVEYLAQKDGYYVSINPNAPADAKPAEVVLLGSDGMAREFDLGPKKITAAELIAAAQASSGLTPAEWNAQPIVARDKRIGEQYEVSKAQATAAALNPSSTSVAVK